MSFNAIRENKILAKISESTVYNSWRFLIYNEAFDFNSFMHKVQLQVNFCGVYTLLILQARRG